MLTLRGWECSNVDRLTAIWQSLNPNTWFDGDSKSLLKKHLTPFHKDGEGTLFTSADVKDWCSLGYEYAITKGRHQGNIKSEIGRLYGNNTHKLPDRDDYILSIKYDR